MLNAKVVSLKRHGKEKVKNKPAIENEDLVRLKSWQVLSLSCNPLAYFETYDSMKEGLNGVVAFTVIG